MSQDIYAILTLDTHLNHKKKLQNYKKKLHEPQSLRGQEMCRGISTHKRIHYNSPFLQYTRINFCKCIFISFECILFNSLNIQIALIKLICFRCKEISFSIYFYNNIIDRLYVYNLTSTTYFEHIYNNMYAQGSMSKRSFLIGLFR